MKPASWPILLVALVLAFALAASPLALWVQALWGWDAVDVKIGLFGVTLFSGLVAAHSADLWRELPPERRAVEALPFAAAQLLRALVYVAIFGAGIRLLRRADEGVLDGVIAIAADSWWESIFDVVFTGVMVWGATRGADWAGERVWPSNLVQTVRAPDAARLSGLSKPFQLRSVAQQSGIYFAAFCAALSVLCLAAHAWSAVAARTRGAAPAPLSVWIVAGLCLLAAAIYGWRCSLSQGAITNSAVTPRAGDAFGWWQIARVEETRYQRFLAADEQHLIFRDAHGQTLWRLTLDTIDEGDRRTLLALFPPHG